MPLYHLSTRNMTYNPTIRCNCERMRAYMYACVCVSATVKMYSTYYYIHAFIHIQRLSRRMHDCASVCVCLEETENIPAFEDHDVARIAMES